MSTIAELAQLDARTVAEKILEARRDEADWLDEFSAVLDRRRAGQGLGRILDAWGLSQSQAARLFGVTRQAVGKWLARGVPAERAEALADLAAATDLLVRYVKRDRIPGVVRHRAAVLDGKSLIDLIAESRTRDALEACRSMFDFENAQA